MIRRTPSGGSIEIKVLALSLLLSVVCLSYPILFFVQSFSSRRVEHGLFNEEMKFLVSEPGFPRNYHKNVI